MAQEKLTIIAELRDRVSGPLQRVERSVRSATGTVEDHGTAAQKAHDRAARAVSEQAEDTRKAETKLDRYLNDITGSADSMARGVATATDKGGRALDDLANDGRDSADKLDRYLEDAGERGGRGMLSNLKAAGTRFVAEAKDIGEEAGDKLAAGVEGALDNIDTGALGGMAGGATVVGGVTASLQRDTASRAAAAASDADPEEMRALIDGAYRDNFGGSYEQVTTSGVAIVGTFDVEPGSEEAERLLRGNLTMEQVFGLDPNMLALGVKMFMDTEGLSPEESQDVLAGVLQRAAPAARDEVLDNINEYIPNLANTGISSTGIATFMAEGSQIGGAYGSDKTGDLMKEWQIIAADPSKDQANAYAELGLDAGEINTLINEGRGDEAFQMTANAVREADPADQGRLAIGVYGTPIEDLGLANVDKYTELWGEAATEASAYQGVVEGIQGTMAEGPGAAFGRLLRTAGESIVAIGDDIAPYLTPFFEALTLVAPYTGELLLLFGGISALRGAGKGLAWLSSLGVDLDDIGKGGKKAGGALRGLGAVITKHPIALIAVGIYTAIEAFGWLYDNVEWVRGAFDGASDAVSGFNDWLVGVGEGIDGLIEKVPGLQQVLDLGGATTFVQDQVNTHNEESFANGLHNSDFFTGTRRWLGTGEFGNSGEGFFRMFHGSDNEKAAKEGHAEGGWTSGNGYYAGERGREFITSAWASNKIETENPGALAFINTTGQLPGGGNVTIAPTIRIDGAQDASAVGAQVEAALERLVRKAERGYMTPSVRGAS